VIESALRAGARAVQLRDKLASTRSLTAVARDLLPLTRGHGALLFINDRVDVALAVEADGVHLGPDDPPIAAIRPYAPPGMLIGYSTDAPDEALNAEAAGASYIGCGAIWGTSTKDVRGEAIGLDRLRQVAEAVQIPVIAIGGVTPERVPEVLAAGAAGAAVVGAVMKAADPEAAVKALLKPWSLPSPE
jgi:thiamine-phosphate pyrophosphorylase